MKSSCHSVIPLLLSLQLPFPKTWLNSIHLLPRSYPGWLASWTWPFSWQLNSSSTEFSQLLTTISSSLDTSHCTPSGWIPWKTPSSIVRYCFRRVSDPLPINRHIVVHVGSRGNMFTKSLHSSGSIHHNIYSFVIFCYWDITSWSMTQMRLAFGTEDRWTYQYQIFKHPLVLLINTGLCRSTTVFPLMQARLLFLLVECSTWHWLLQ
jgi:hypothetical protein